MEKNFKDLGYEYKEIVIHSIKEIIEFSDEYQRSLRLPRIARAQNEPEFQVFFRGQSNSEWKIEPSILRSKVKEADTVNNLAEFAEFSLFETIAHIQHYKTGTRFIDFTTNIDVAMFFACGQKFDTDGAIYIYSYGPHRCEWYTTTAIVELAILENAGKISVETLSKRLYNKYEIIRKRHSSISELSMSLISFLDHGFMVIPEEKVLKNNLRLKRQNGCFYICGVEFENELTSQMRWESNAGNNYFFPHTAVIPKSLDSGRGLVKIIIPKELKPEIITYLQTKGITNDYLFPSEDKDTDPTSFRLS